MLSAIDLDNQLRLNAAKIDNVTIKSPLAFELPVTETPTAQVLPKHAFGIRHALSQRPCVRTDFAHATLTPTLSRQRERELPHRIASASKSQKLSQLREAALAS